MINREHYLRKLKTREKESRAYTKHQMFGIELAEILEDKAHTSLYIKLAKNRRAEELLRIAKSIAENKRVKNKGAYFMAMLSQSTDTI